MQQRLALKRPLVFFDLETTGLNITQDRIVELAFLKVHPDGRQEELHSLVNPLMPIPPSSSKVHGITDEMVAEQPPFHIIGKQVAEFINDADLAGYNCERFDLPLLAEEFNRAGIMIDLKRGRRVIDVQVIFHKREPRTLSAAYSFYCNRTLEDAHSAHADTVATYEVLLGQLAKYPDLPGDPVEISQLLTDKRYVDLGRKFYYDEADIECFAFGKYEGQSVEQVLRNNPGYFDWMMRSDFPNDTKRELVRIQMRLEQ